jgi:hypothetical protein
MAAQAEAENDPMFDMMKRLPKVLEINPKSPLIEGLLERVLDLPGVSEEDGDADQGQDQISADAQELSELVKVLLDTTLVRSGFAVSDPTTWVISWEGGSAVMSLKVATPRDGGWFSATSVGSRACWGDLSVYPLLQREQRTSNPLLRLLLVLSAKEEWETTQEAIMTMMTLVPVECQIPSGWIGNPWKINWSMMSFKNLRRGDEERSGRRWQVYR